MNKQQIIPHGLLYPVVPERFAHLHLSNNPFGNDTGWDDSENQYEGESLASNVLEFLQEIAAE